MSGPPGYANSFVPWAVSRWHPGQRMPSADNPLAVGTGAPHGSAGTGEGQEFVSKRLSRSARSRRRIRAGRGSRL